MGFLAHRPKPPTTAVPPQQFGQIELLQDDEREGEGAQVHLFGTSPKDFTLHELWLWGANGNIDDCAIVLEDWRDALAIDAIFSNGCRYVQERPDFQRYKQYRPQALILAAYDGDSHLLFVTLKRPQTDGPAAAADHSAGIPHG